MFRMKLTRATGRAEAALVVQFGSLPTTPDTDEDARLRSRVLPGTWAPPLSSSQSHLGFETERGFKRDPRRTRGLHEAKAAR